ncbi:hypothetical protein DFH07DRAFT_958062 [Mycena maculata]|uniref:Uncharacterized protein n=1 Tax=Mycena maculata TaxID=230809 RepID=A0AAD7NFQ6_9AGAR|nr:hypothetical protein DFH07DRAFT_958062 [Mycena maculata]
MDLMIAPPRPKPSPHAAAQARYRARNTEAEGEKARLRMHKKHELSKKEATVQEQLYPMRVPFIFPWLLPAHPFNSPEFLAFREYVNKVKTIQLSVNRDDPAEVAEFDRLIATNPCVEDLGPATDEVVSYYYWLQVHFNRYPEWEEELADYQDIVQEHTAEQLD